MAVRGLASPSRAFNRGTTPSPAPRRVDSCSNTAPALAPARTPSPSPPPRVPLPVATLKPIPEATWLRLAALEPRCHISMWRDQQWLVHGSGGRMVWGVGAPPAPTRRVWRVRVFLRGSARTHDIIDADEPHLADGLERAIAEAERRGWHQPQPAPVA